MDLSQRLANLQKQCAAAPGVQPRLLAVSKTVPARTLRAAYALGLRHFGENYLQEALAKQAELADLDIQWHFIGRIQRNKTQAIAEHFQWVESVDRLLIAERLHAARGDLPPLNCLIEVAISGEASKGGVAPAEVLPLARAMTALPGLRLRGLMALANPDPQLAPQDFAAMARLYGQLQEQLPSAGIDTLSMGTSGDYPLAIAAGATEIRIGTALFGARA
ncbi:YggS family pyridoxal phosphate-dependent enzyme [Acidithiobacillus sulfuriphilus]|uniref:Pyridoxal phosphate homeostasis protein n=2 Tax=Acidithiobacillus sulfuriphilus TaxID=1867749 RepID=A0A3M8RRM0_9PROT|nr:YggS family pyridoxal phosphate-dependent enzyme [Acidithiobacillus sulfuriphilus]RNF71278.1 YggS family pyridoxal phosphate-dependent enzyme [Acidithiobacillus sulfuriphilus]